MYDCGELRKGLKIEIDGEPYVITRFEFVKPGKGQALYKCRLKNMITQSQFDRTYRSGEKFNRADLSQTAMEYLYYDGDNFCFMNATTYEQEFLSREQVGDALNLLKENTVCDVLLFDQLPIGVSLPNFVELTVAEAEPWVKGDTASGNNRPVTLETGYTLNAPSFIQPGEIIRIDTRTGEYVERVKS